MILGISNGVSDNTSKILHIGPICLHGDAGCLYILLIHCSYIWPNENTPANGKNIEKNTLWSASLNLFINSSIIGMLRK